MLSGLLFGGKDRQNIFYLQIIYIVFRAGQNKKEAAACAAASYITYHYV